MDTAGPARRIVALTPGLTELVYAAGAGQYLVGTVQYADYPQAATRVARVGDAFRVDTERLLALKPDLVLAWSSGTAPATVARLKSLGLRVESLEALRIDAVAATLLRIGEWAGTQSQAQQTAQQFSQGMQALRDRYAHSESLRVFIAVNRQPLYTVNGQHVLSEVLALCGGQNVFADLDQLAPVVGVEAVLRADADVLLTTDGTLAQWQQDWQAWPQLTAVRRRNLYVVSADTTTRATPRLLQGAQQICDTLQRAREHP